MDPQISPWEGYCVGYGATWVSLLGKPTGAVGRPWPGFPTKNSCVLTIFLPLCAFGCFLRRPCHRVRAKQGCAGGFPQLGRCPYLLS